MNRRAWQSIRAVAIRKASYRCSRFFWCGGRSAFLDVISDGGKWLVLCRSCRCQRDGKKRTASAAITRQARRAQLRLPISKGRAA